MNVFFGIAAILLTVYSCSQYIEGMLRKIIKPHAFSWLPWSIMMGIGFLIQVKNGEDFWGSGTFGISTIGCFIIFFMSLKFWEKNITKSDTFSLISSLFLILFWLTTKNDILALVLVILIDTISFFPTWRKSYYKPYEETLSMYWMSSLKSFLSLFSLRYFVLTNWLYPVFLTLINIGFTGYLVWRRKIMKK